jgi:hypothetical protein
VRNNPLGLVDPTGLEAKGLNHIQPAILDTASFGETDAPWDNEWKSANEYFDMGDAREVMDTLRDAMGENVTTRDILELIWNAYPQWDVPESRGAADVILEVLKKRYPCSKWADTSAE